MTDKDFEAIARLRKDDPLIVMEWYCRNDECPTREIKFNVKDYDVDLLKILEFRGVQCPLCGEDAAFHHARSYRQAHEDFERDARCSVNQQMYLRDKDTIALPSNVMLKSDLPPTPPGWWDKG